jgi:aryl-alcohol dehydrogenase-like predicted oxidoreductase
MIPKKTFGRTDHQSSRAIFGAFAVGLLSQDESNRVLDLLLEYGINHIDTAPSYNEAEDRIGPWMEHHRNDFFLATKVDKRTYKEAREQIQQSLERLHVDSVDLLQLHYLVDPQEWEMAMGPDGALEAIIEAREKGWTRYLGVTGHDVVVGDMHLRSLERFDFDSVLLPYNFPMMQNPVYATNFEKIVAICQQKNIAVQTIKSLAHGPWGHVEPQYHTWYRPLEDQADIDRAVHWILGNPNVFLNTSGDARLLPKILDAASRFDPGDLPADSDMQAMVDQQQMQPLFT